MSMTEEHQNTLFLIFSVSIVKFNFITMLIQ